MFAVIIAVGPGETEYERTLDLVESIVAHEPGARNPIVILDDAPVGRDLISPLRHIAGDRVIVRRHLRRTNSPDQTASPSLLGPLCVGVLQLLGWVADNVPRDELRFVLKLDTDALVIAPFAAQIERTLARNANAGLIGAYRKTPVGSAREIGHHAAIMSSLHRETMRWRRPGSILRNVGSRLGLCGTESADLPTSQLSRAFTQARRAGYRYGEHCLGGAYALSAQLLYRLRDARHLDDAPKWMETRCTEDVMLGMYVRAMNLEMADAVDAGDPFGIRYVGLPYSPEELLERGYSLIHSVKNDSQLSESEIRAFFRERRQSDAVRLVPSLELTLSARKRTRSMREADVA